MRDAEREGSQQADRDWAEGNPRWQTFNTRIRADVDVDPENGIPHQFRGWCLTGWEDYDLNVIRAYNARLRALVRSQGLPPNSLRAWFLPEKELLLGVSNRDSVVPWTELLENRELWDVLDKWTIYASKYTYSPVPLEPGRYIVGIWQEDRLERAVHVRNGVRLQCVTAE